MVAQSNPIYQISTLNVLARTISSEAGKGKLRLRFFHYFIFIDSFMLTLKRLKVNLSLPANNLINAHVMIIAIEPPLRPSEFLPQIQFCRAVKLTFGDSPAMAWLAMKMEDKLSTPCPVRPAENCWKDRHSVELRTHEAQF
jgi:hypothetical protein